MSGDKARKEEQAKGLIGSCGGRSHPRRYNRLEWGTRFAGMRARLSSRPVRQPMRVVAMAGRVESRPSGSRVWL